MAPRNVLPAQMLPCLPSWRPLAATHPGPHCPGAPRLLLRPVWSGSRFRKRQLERSLKEGKRYSRIEEKQRGRKQQRERESWEDGKRCMLRPGGFCVILRGDASPTDERWALHTPSVQGTVTRLAGRARRWSPALSVLAAWSQDPERRPGERVPDSCCPRQPHCEAAAHPPRTQNTEASAREGPRVRSGPLHGHVFCAFLFKDSSSHCYGWFMNAKLTANRIKSHAWLKLK